MALYEGTRSLPRRPAVSGGSLFPTTASARGARKVPAALPRRPTARPVRARRRPHAAGVVLAAIMTAFLLGLTYLVQTMHVAATGFDMARLAEERDRLTQQLRSVEGTILRSGAEPVVIEEAQKRGFDRLGEPLRIPAP